MPVLEWKEKEGSRQTFFFELALTSVPPRSGFPSLSLYEFLYCTSVSWIFKKLRAPNFLFSLF